MMSNDQRDPGAVGTKGITELAQDAANRWWAQNPDSLQSLPAGMDLWLLSVAVMTGDKLSSSCLGFHMKDLPAEAVVQGRQIIDATAREQGVEPQLYCARVLAETTKRPMREAGELPLLAAIYLLPDDTVDSLRQPLAEKEFQMMQFLVDDKGVQFSVSPFRKFDD